MAVRWPISRTCTSVPALARCTTLVTIAILWFAGASAMAGLLNLVPLYLPRYGMAPEWARATRPLVVIFTCIGIVVTVIFSADVEAQAGAYATGVLVLITSGAVAVAIAAWRQNNRWPLFASITLVFVYTSVTNMIERPEGIKIASVFILSIIITSLVSRTLRSTELRVLGIQPDPLAEQFIDDASRGERSISSPIGPEPETGRSTTTSCGRRGKRII